MSEYPLEMLERVRAEQTDAARRVHQQAASELEAAEARLRGLAAAENEAGRALAELESSPVAAGAAHELLARDAFRGRLKRERLEAEAARQACATEVRAAREKVEACRLALAEARAAERVVQTHHERFDASRRRAAEQREELEMDERAGATHRGRGRS